ncbi:MAG: 6-phosphogluconolactonase [Cyclobacteriaceae bacterium]|nr:6-phosphogluconolactonase [Cyclobacteriaceae bacterium]
MISPKFKIYKNTDELVGSFSAYFNSLILKKTGLFSVALSGGSTPKAWFDHLASHHKNDIPWHNVHFYWGDERCVPPDHAESNYGMAKKHLLDHLPIPKDNIHRIEGELPPQESAEKYASLLENELPVAACPVFDLVILGMGDDGHTASIFPHEISLWHAPAYCVVASHPQSGQQRVSISGQIINAARAVAFLVTGENKAQKIEEIFHKKPQAERYPAFLVAPEHEPPIWFLDQAAAKSI